MTLSIAPDSVASTGWVELKALIEDGMVIAKNLVPVEIVVPDANAIGGLSRTRELKVSKMQDSLTAIRNMGEFTKKHLKAEHDADRFYIRFPDGAILSKLGGLAANISTRECPNPTYNDPSTEMDLALVGTDLISPAMILVSDETDDTFAEDFVNCADEVRNDPTHRVQLGGKVRLGSVKAGGIWHTINQDIPVKRKRTVTVDFVILDDGETDVAATTATLERDLKAANERYAQIGVEIIKGALAVKPLPPNLDLPGGDLIVSKPTLTNRELTDDIKRIIDVHGTNSSLDDLHVFYVPLDLKETQSSDIEGVGLNKAFKAMNDGYQDNVFIERMAWPFGLAHELGHILTDDAHFLPEHASKMPNPNLYVTNLMYNHMTFDASFFDGKRLLDIQEAKVHSNRHSIPVTP